jgi:thymidylate kinase
MIDKLIDEKKRGLLIVFEGIKNSGKSTQAKKLINYFKSIKKQCESVNFPCIIIV